MARRIIIEHDANRVVLRAVHKAPEVTITVTYNKEIASKIEPFITSLALDLSYSSCILLRPCRMVLVHRYNANNRAMDLAGYVHKFLRTLE